MNGHARERQVRERLQEDGWVVVRAAGSLGIADLVAGKWGATRLIEVKANHGSPYMNFRATDRAMLLSAALQAGWEPWLIHWPARGEMRWIPATEWPVVGAAKAAMNALEQAA